MKENLEKQLEEKRQRLRQEHDEKKKFEQLLMQNLKDKEQNDMLKKNEHFDRARQQKVLREQQMIEALNKKKNDM